MLRALSIFLALFAWLAPAAQAQNEARTVVYTRQVGDTIHAAAVVRVTHGWYLYHTDPGDTEFARPLEVTIGDGWDVVVPEPKTKEVEDETVGKYSYNYHEGKVVLYARGNAAEGATPEDQWNLTGLTCSNITEVCVPYNETATPSGEGKAKYWEDWPASLGASPLANVAAEVEAPTEETSSAPVSFPQDSPPSGIGTSGGFSAFGGGNTNEKVKAKLYTRFDDEKNLAQMAVVIDIQEGWYIYNGPTTDDLGDPEAIGTPTTLVIHDDSYAIEWGEVQYPKGKKKEDEFLPWYWQHFGQVVLRVDGDIIDELDEPEIYVELGYQVCSDVCDPPATIEVYAEEGPGEDAWFVADTYVAKGDLDSGEEEEPSLFWFLMSAVGWGIFTLLMPCTYPMIPITISFFTKQAEARNGNVLPLSLAYGTGIVAVFILIGLVFAPVIIPFATHWVTNTIIGVMFLFFAFVLFGMVNLQPPAALMNLASKASTSGGYIGVFLMGATLVITSFTCTAPFVGTLLGSAAAGGEGDLMRIVLGMGVFGLTMATPFVFLSLVPGEVSQMPQAGEWMNTLKVYLGFVELAAALKFLSNVDLKLNWGIFGRDIFLILWAVIFAAAGIYLIKKAIAQAEYNGPGTRQKAFGVLTILFAGYCAYGVPGNSLDQYVMTALVPPYATNPAWDPNKAQHSIVTDDWELAKGTAQEEQKLLLVNFTGKI